VDEVAPLAVFHGVERLHGSRNLTDMRVSPREEIKNHARRLPGTYRRDSGKYGDEVADGLGESHLKYFNF
jgi:hypothetical protein